MSRQGLYDHNGTLFKWTNYWTGWQSRWFVLRDGILAYYNSYEEISQGCKSSVNVSAVDMQVVSADNVRFNLLLQDGQLWYLKANTSADRQKWLIALGTAKARKSTDSSRDEIFRKMSELRLYHDALSAHVKDLKAASSQEENTDITKIEEISNMLSITCDTFLSTLNNCMKIADGSFLPMHTRRRMISEETPVVLPQRDLRYTRSQSADCSILRPKRSAISPPPLTEMQLIESAPMKSAEIANDIKSLNLNKLKISTTSIPSSTTQKQMDRGAVPSESDTCESSSDDVSNHSNHVETKESEVCDGTNEAPNADIDSTVQTEPDYLTFFTSMLHSFTDIEMDKDGEIPSISFLDACEDLLPFFDKIGSTAFAPVKMDLQGNIKKVRTKVLTNPAQFNTIQNVVRHEMDTKTTKIRNSATDAILWLKRALRLIQVFLTKLIDGNHHDSTTALNLAYAETLRRYHSWVVRGIFAVAARATPNSADFFKVLGSRPDTSNHSLPSRILVRDIDNYVTAIDVVLTVLDSFYSKYRLDDDNLV